MRILACLFTLIPTTALLLACGPGDDCEVTLTCDPPPTGGGGAGAGSQGGYPCEDMHSACLRVIHWFGAERCVWGSDFPCELWTPRVSYQEALDIFRTVLPLSADARAQILGGTARRLWFS